MVEVTIASTKTYAFDAAELLDDEETVNPVPRGSAQHERLRPCGACQAYCGTCTTRSSAPSECKAASRRSSLIGGGI